MIELNSGDIGESANFHPGYNGQEKKRVWATIAGWDKLLIVLVAVSLLSALVGLFILLTPVLNVVLSSMGLRYAGWNEWQIWIMEGGRILIIAAALGLASLLCALLARYRVRGDYSFYVEAGCPQCHEHDLIRVRRNRRDRTLGKLALPVRRYSCRNCTWHGVRLSGYRYIQRNEEDEVFELDQLEDGANESQPELIEESLPFAEMEMEANVNAELQTFEPTPVDNSVDWVEEPSDIGEEVTYESSVYDEELTALTQVDETADIVTVDDDDSSNPQAVDEQTQDTIEEIDDLQSEHLEENSGNDEGLASEAEDDDFARLCHEVALSK